MSKIAEWFVIFYKEYICLNLNSYENIGSNFPIVKIFLAVALAAVICGIMLDYYNKYTYLLIKALLRHEATEEGKAKTLGELGLSGVRPIERSLSGSGKLSAIVARCGSESLTYEEYIERERSYKAAKKQDRSLKRSEYLGEKIDFESAKFYICEDGKPYAMRVFNGADVSVIRTVLRSLFIVIISIAAVFIMPTLLGWINGILG